jgi:Domain of unknown function (DUF4382)
MKRISCVLAIALAACSGSNNSNVTLSARAGSAASTAASPVGQQTQALQACDGFVITRVRMVLSEVKLEAEQTASDAGTSSGEVEFKSAPSLLDLAQSNLDSGTTQQVTVAEIPAGTYREIKFKIHKISQSEAGTNAGLQDMANASVKVDYTKNGVAQPTFTTDVDAQQQLEGSFPLTEGNHALTLNLDASTWFTKGTTCLDPANQANLSDINNNIQKSLKAYKDDDHDGHEDR